MTDRSLGLAAPRERCGVSLGDHLHESLPLLGSQLQVLGDGWPAEHRRRPFPLQLDLAEADQLVAREILREPVDLSLVDRASFGDDGRARLSPQPRRPAASARRSCCCSVRNLSGLQAEVSLNVRAGEQEKRSRADPEPRVGQRPLTALHPGREPGPSR